MEGRVPNNIPITSYIIISMILVLVLFIIKFYVNIPLSSENAFGQLDFAATAKLECDKVETYCFTDEDCNDKCFGILNTYICLTGVCRRSTMHTEESKNQCAPEKGVIAFASFDPLQNVTFTCSSIDPYIANNNPDVSSIMCAGGLIDIDYTNHFPQMKDCTCPSGQIPLMVIGNSQIRSYVTCVDKNFEGIYEKYKTIDV